MKSRIFNILTIVLFLTSCSDFLDEKMKDKVNEKDFFKTMQDCDMALNYCYSCLSSKDYTYANWFAGFQTPCIMTDELVWNTSGSLRDISYCNMSEKDASVYLVWTRSYAAVNWANRTIRGIRNASCFESDEVRNRYIAEAGFIRAIFYFNLVRFFGDVPLYTEPAESLADAAVSRSPSIKVYNLIVNDLKFAKEWLPSKSAVQRTGQATKGAAAALLAKVYAQMSGNPLYCDMWEECRKEAEYVIGLNGSDITGEDGYKLYDSYFNIFHPDHENNCEVIFDVQFAEGSVYGSTLGSYFSGVGGDVEMGGRGTALSAIVLKEHAAMYKTSKDGVRDPRYDRNIGDKSLGNGTNLLSKPATDFSIKKFARLDTPQTGYKNNWGIHGCPVNVIMLRLADIYLIYAEALNELNESPVPDAYEYLNKVRRRAWNRDVNSPDPDVDLAGLDYNSFRQAIMDERSVELCFEGHRWFDLVRWNKLTEVVKATSQPAAANISGKHYLYPVPEDEIRLNPNLTQNPGWSNGPAL